MEIYEAWCEWDIGLERTYFTTRREARKAIEKGLKDGDCEETYQELLDEGLVGIEVADLVGPINVFVPSSDHSFWWGRLGEEQIIEGAGSFYEYHEGEPAPEGTEVFTGLVVR